MVVLLLVVVVTLFVGDGRLLFLSPFYGGNDAVVSAFFAYFWVVRVVLVLLFLVAMATVFICLVDCCFWFIVIFMQSR